MSTARRIQRGRHASWRDGSPLRDAAFASTSFRELAFTLNDSLSATAFRAFRSDTEGTREVALQATIGASALSWERINQRLLASAVWGRDRRGSAGLLVTETHILEASDSRLLYDGVRV